jgi:hypothetical protein
MCSIATIPFGKLSFEGFFCIVIVNGSMISTIKEGLNGEIQVVMNDRKGRLLLRDKSYCCGIELE